LFAFQNGQVIASLQQLLLELIPVIIPNDTTNLS
jgi:hypothetical protein